MWRKIDERYIKPVLGGRQREDPSVPRGLAEYLLSGGEGSDETYQERNALGDSRIAPSAGSVGLRV